MAKLVLWGTLIMAASLLIVLALLMVLLAELYCSILRSPEDGQACSDEENQFQLPRAVLGSSPNDSQQGNSLRLIGLISTSPPAAKPQDQAEVVSQAALTQEGGGKERLVYISNPIYDHIVVRDSGGGSSSVSSRSMTPFQTPETSPSRLETEEDEEEDIGEEEDSVSPPLAPMKKLPLRAPSLTLSATTDSNIATSSCYSFSPPDTSPSW